MSDQFVGEIRMFLGGTIPPDWALCDGSTLSISTNEVLYSLLGTQFGGDGNSTFALPDLRGRLPLGPGQGAGLPSFSVGDYGGDNLAQITVDTMPSHNHSIQVRATAAAPPLASPVGNYPARSASRPYSSDPPDDYFKWALDEAGQGAAPEHNNMMPYMPVNFIIALQGEFPHFI